MNAPTTPPGSHPTSATAVPLPFPAGPVQRIEARAVAVVGNDIDTDRIIPARFLKCVTFEGLAEGAFADDRRELAGAHPFDRPAHQGASILVVNANFGCGSSREHAPQALMRWGIRAVVGESFAEIFFGNCLALGIPCLTATPAAIQALQRRVAEAPATVLRLDLEGLQLQILPAATEAAAEPPLALGLPEGPHRMLVSGQWDATSQLLAQEEALRATAARLPYLSGFSTAA